MNLNLEGGRSRERGGEREIEGGGERERERGEGKRGRERGSEGRDREGERERGRAATRYHVFDILLREARRDERAPERKKEKGILIK